MKINMNKIHTISKISIKKYLKINKTLKYLKY